MINLTKIKLINIYTLNISASKYIKQTLTDIIKGEIHSNIVVVIGAFQTHLYQWKDHPQIKSIMKHWP